ncbi:MAG: aminofutalosine deaminase family hydrolase [Wolinella sp.]
MKIIGASRLFLCDEACTILCHGAVVIVGAKIAGIGDFSELCALYPNAKSSFFDDSVLLPGLINAHTHIEFSANTTDLEYGSFGRWLDSVIKKRESIMLKAQSAMKDALSELLRTGTTSIGAISSSGLDLEILASAPLRVVFFNEIIGSNEALLDVLWRDFCARVDKSEEHRSARFTPAIALHSPYSLHKELAMRALERAKNLNAPISAHYLESQQEREWLEKSSGFFHDFFTSFFKQDTPKAQYTPFEFLELLRDRNAIIVHGIEMKKEEIDMVQNLGIALVSCPRSNRLLSGKLLDFRKIYEAQIPISFATDGRSSNFSLSLLDELRIALFAYTSEDIESLARALLLGITRNPAKALGLNCGRIETGAEADLAIFGINGISHSNQEILHFILHAKEAKSLYIAGEKIF